MTRRAHPFRFEKRSSKRGDVYYVRYDIDPARPKSTGVLVNPKDRKESWEPAGYDDAVAWAYAHAETLETRTSVTFGQFAEHFFDPEQCTWTKRQLVRSRRKNRPPWGPSYLQTHRGWLNNYLMPRWKAVPLHLITTKALDEWLIDLDSVRNNIPLAPESLDKVLTVARIVLDEAQYQGYLEHNPAKLIMPYGVGSGKNRLPFTMEEIDQMFPRDLKEAERIWLSVMWYVYFLLQWTTGLRPGEAGIILGKDWIPEHHGAIIQRRIEG